MMKTLKFDSLRYARALRESGMPEPQADVQAELMAEAFGFYAENILTKDHFEAVLDARFAEQDTKFDRRFAEQNTKFDQRLAEQSATFESRFVTLEKTLFLHTWMLGLVALVLVVPQLQVWLA